MKKFNNLNWPNIFEENVNDFLKFVNQKRKEAAKKGGFGSDVLDLLLKGVEIGQENWSERSLDPEPQDVKTDSSNKAEDVESSDPKDVLNKDLSPVKGDVEIGTLSGVQKKNAEIVLKALNKYGIVNPYTQKAILSVIGKESNFVPQNEVSYAGTSNERIRSIFGKRVKDLSDEELTNLKRDEKAFWDKVYGGRYGNDNKGDGSKYRGRGFNQLTFKGNYKKYNRLLQENGVNVDIVSNPDRVNDIDIAAEVNALYFLTGLMNKASKKKFGNDDPNDFTDFNKALGAAVNANAGWGKDIYGSEALRKAQTYAQKFDVEDIKTMA